MLMDGWIVLLPPLLVLIIVVFFRAMIPAFLVGITTGAFIASHADPYATALLIGRRLAESSGLCHLYSWHSFWASWNLLIFLFLLFIGIIITILQRTGAAQGYINVASRHIHDRRSAEFASLIFSLFFFIDDYFSALTVGSVMRPITRSFGVPAVKLAFLVTAMASPLAVIAPISSWVGEIVLQLKQAGIEPRLGSLFNFDPFFVLISAIPVIFYPIFLMVAAWYIVLRRISFGPMSAYENTTVVEPMHEYFVDEKKSRLIDFFLPIATLVVVTLIGMLATGGWQLFGGDRSLIDAIKYALVHQALFVGGISSLVVIIFFFRARDLLHWDSRFFTMVIDGILLMIPSIIMLIHAWALGSILRNDLQTGPFIASWFTLFISDYWMPLLSFILATVVSGLVGSAWATIGLVIPLIIPMIPPLVATQIESELFGLHLAMASIGAVLSGAVLGTHISPIADNPIMVSASTKAVHFEHLRTMSWYLVPVVLATGAAYSVLGFFMAKWRAGVAVSLLIGFLILITLLECANRLFKKK